MTCWPSAHNLSLSHDAVDYAEHPHGNMHPFVRVFSSHAGLQEDTPVVEPVPVYAVNPDRVTIAPKSSCQLEFFGFSAQPGQIEERFVCTFGSGAKSKQTVFDMLARSDTHMLAVECITLCTADTHVLAENLGISLQLCLCTGSIYSTAGKLISRSGNWFV